LERAGRHRIGFIHQELGLAGTMTIVDNFGLVAGYPRRLRLIRWRQARREAAQALARLGSRVDPGATTGELPVADRSLVAIARALQLHPQVLVLDEPTASLAAADVQTLFDSIRRLKEEGIGILY